MSATITDQLKRELIFSIFNRTQNIATPVGDSDRHYIAIGRSQEWDDEVIPPTPYSAVDDELTFRSSVQSMKLISDISYVVPRFSWVAGNSYSAWDSRYGSNTEVVSGVTASAAASPDPYYVLTDDNNVFICVAQGRTSSGLPKSSIFKPNNTSGEPFENGDDYYWQFLYNIGTAESRQFLTSTYMPVERVVDVSAGGPADDQLSVSRLQHRTIQSASVPGQILGIAIDSAGMGYSSAPTITITGIPIGTNTIVDASAYAEISGGIITDIIMKQNAGDANFTFGANYRDASISISGDAKLRAILSSDSGLGGNSVLSLNSSAVMFNVLLDGTENDDFQVTNDFRQIGIYRNPHKDSATLAGFAGNLEATSSTLSAFNKLYVSTGSLTTESITGDQIVSETTGGNASAIVDYYDGNGILYVHQTRETGYEDFGNTANVEISGGGGTATLQAPPSGLPALRPSEVDVYTGDVIYIDNRVAVSRDNDQSEDIKVVIDL